MSISGLIQLVKELYPNKTTIPLHEPVLDGNEIAYTTAAIASTYVSSVGNFVDRFEADVAQYTMSLGACATVNGTAALHTALIVAGLEPGDLVLTQPLAFVASCNAISYCGASPVFVDVDRVTMGLSAYALEEWLEEHAFLDHQGSCRTKDDMRRLRVCLPMHTFGHPVDLDSIAYICSKWQITLVEDAAEGLGSLYKGTHVGTKGLVSALSFNGNKIVTTGGGGMVLSSSQLARRAKFLTTTAKRPHPYEFFHNEIGYNYRMPNLNAALGCAQMECIGEFVRAKRTLASLYKDELRHSSLQFVEEPSDCQSNYWLNSVICEDRRARDDLLVRTNAEGIQTRPIWTLLNRLPMYDTCLKGPLNTAEWLEQRVVNLPSSVIRRLR